MAVSTFGVTYSAVKNHHFPQLGGDFSTTTKPTATTVGEMIDAEAADLEGALLAKDLVASTLDDDTASAAYKWCAETIRLGAAVRALQAMLTADPEVVKAWQAKLNARYKKLEDKGGIVLGIAEDASDLSSGPRSHITTHSLDTGDDQDISDVVPVFRRNDPL